MKTKVLGMMSIAAIGLLTGCGSSGGSSGETAAQVNGQFIDSAIAGLNYECSSGINGVTDLFGMFTCTAGDTISFNINGFQIGSSLVGETITPRTLYPNNPEVVTNLAQLLQTIDSDNNPANGIQIDSKSFAVEALATADVALEQVDFDSAIVTYIGMPLIDEAIANAHLNESIQNAENASAGLTSLSTVVVMNGLDAEFCANLQNSESRTFEGFADYADFIAQGGSQSIDYFPSAQNCSSYSAAGFCEVQDFTNTPVAGSGSCVQTITFPFVPGTGETDGGTNNTAEVSFSEYTTIYKPMMPNLRSDNVWFSGTSDEMNNIIVSQFQAMTAEEKIAEGLYFIGGNPQYGYELYTDSYSFGTNLSTRYYLPNQGIEQLIGEWDVEIVDNVHTKIGESKSTKFSKKIAVSALHQMYLEVGMDIPFDDNDMAQFMITSDSVAYGYVALAVNQSAYLKIMTAFETYATSTN